MSDFKMGHERCGTGLESSCHLHRDHTGECRTMDSLEAQANDIHLAAVQQERANLVERALKLTGLLTEAVAVLSELTPPEAHLVAAQRQELLSRARRYLQGLETVP